ncbi:MULTISPECIES: phage protein [Vibrio harveyi group]|uniref:phage protein n=1 Tax=Vibrio harveyi group TaxID=717610 RepID=UPI00111E2415|nr:MULTISPECIES: phage protein [Vibrio harveyi group]ELP3329372.1 phage protein [Vibrio alginolyticus]MCC3844843.1 phage protein [Vibrio parahaemolyticus]TOO34141.1 regulator [Vibrio parahaemolyticus]TOO39916.1 regulator [Vibrio parahaemolyticus]UFN71096.1 phage protein [Vibrio alginolyticus]
MKYHEMTKNYIFREFECGLTIEEAAKLCLKTVRTIKEWDKGKSIPPECKRLMRMNKGRELSSCEEWENFIMRHDRLELPTGQLVTAQQVLIGVALLEIGASEDSKLAYKVLKYARALKNMYK